MNDIHCEEVDMLNELDELFIIYAENNAAAEQLDTKLDAFFEHMNAHFKAEEIQMEAIKFPPYPVHKSEHDGLLQHAQKQIINWKETRQLEPISQFVRDELIPWLIQHISTMDKVTAVFIAKAGKELIME
jgi:hemerythrin